MYPTIVRTCTLDTLAALLLLTPSTTSRAQDTRTVTEPVFPAACTTLTAQMSITSGGPSSETAFDTPRIQAALSTCGSGKAVEQRHPQVRRQHLRDPAQAKVVKVELRKR